MKKLSFKTSVYWSLGMFAASLLTLTLAVAEDQGTTQSNTQRHAAASESVPAPATREAQSGMATGRQEVSKAGAVGAKGPPNEDAAEAKKHVANVKWSDRQAVPPSMFDGAPKDAAKAKVSNLNGASKDAAKSSVKPKENSSGQSSGK